MEFVSISRREACAIVTLSRGRVNAIDQQVVDELSDALGEIERDHAIRSIVLTGSGKFFSFGLDVPALYDLTPDQFALFLRSFCSLCTKMFLFPKPIVAAVNGHAVAGGFILMLPCDSRIAADTPMAIALNEVTLGAGLFAGTVEMLRYRLGNSESETLLLTGKTIDTREALRIGLLDQMVEPAGLIDAAVEKANGLATHYGPGFKMIRRLIRGPIAERWQDREERSIADFVNIWYSPETRAKTKLVQIRS